MKETTNKKWHWKKVHDVVENKPRKDYSRFERVLNRFEGRLSSLDQMKKSLNNS